MPYPYKQGGAREGAGRPSLGRSKTIKLTLPEDSWEYLQDMIMYEHAKSVPDAIRKIIEGVRK